MHLVLVESPTKTKTLEKFLGKDYKVLASYGHVRDLPKSKLGVDIENNFDPQYIIPIKARKNIKHLKEALKKADNVYLATDPDREGEAISFHLLHALDVKEYKRITFNEITKKAVEEALKNPRQIDMSLVDAQQARRVLDRLVGYKLSPLLWKKITKGLSAGRVQSVALRIITDREKEIECFKKEDYWSIVATLSTKEKIFSSFLKEENKKKIGKLGIKSKEDAERIKNDLENAVFTVKAIEKKEKKRNPLPPFTTSTLQQEAFKKLNFSSSFTMRVAQSLYEKGLITYHRTDSLNISAEAKRDGEKYIQKTFGEEYYKERVYATKGKTQEAHEAVRPSNPSLSPEEINLKKEEFRLYNLIWRRFIASLMSEAVFYSTKIEIDAKSKNEYLLSSSGSLLKFDGFTKIYPIKFEETELPFLQEKENLKKEKIVSEKHSTKPPARFTEASLIKELEKHGIGRPSTYAPTLSTIAKRNYTEKIEKKYLKPTEIGIIVSDLLLKHFPFVVDLKFTAKMEEDLDKITQGEINWQNLIKDFYEEFAKTLEKKELEIKKEDIMQETTDEKCGKCGGDMQIKFGKFGKFIACKNFPECKNTKPINGEEEESEEVTCDKCGSQMVLKQSRFGKFYGCSKYPECKNIKSIEEDLDIRCPECKEGDVVKRKSKKGNVFYACNRYPDCEFTSSSLPKKEEPL
jgi:DNA topoisomerase I